MRLLTDKLRYRRTAVFSTVLAGLLVAAACAPGQDDSDDTASDSEVDPEPTEEPAAEEGPASLVVWTDAGRQPGFEAYQAEHPEVELTIETLPEDPQQQLILANQAGEGWPDVAWVRGGGLGVLAYRQEPVEFAGDISEFVPQEVLDGYAPGIQEHCLGDNGEVFCLRNDIAPMVLWYDAELMEEFGYDVPTTWEEYEELSLRLVAEHPDYVAGGIPPDAGQAFLAASGCPMHDPVAEQTIHTDLQDPSCTRVTNLFDNLIGAGALAPMLFNSPEFAAQYGIERKMLMQVGPIFWGVNFFQNNFEWPDGAIGLAPFPRWEGDDEASNFSAGGGHYMVSKHTEFPQAAADLVLWMATGPFQEQASTLPAYGPAQSTWIADHAAAFAAPGGDPAGAIQQSIDTIRDDWQYIPLATVWRAVAQVVVPAVAGEGRTITEMLPAWEERIVQEAEAAGWTVETG